MRNIVVMKRSGEHKGKYVFLWTGNVVGESTAKRYNHAYQKLIKEGFPKDEITVNMLHGNWYLTRPRYKGTKKMRTGYLKYDKLDVKTKRILKRPLQLMKTKAGKRTVYYSPTTGKVVTKKVAKKLQRNRFRVCKDIKVNLYRTSVDVDSVSHILVWNTEDIYGKDIRWKNVAQFDMWMKSYNIDKKLRCYAKAVNRIAKRYKFDGVSAQVMGSIRTMRQVRHTNQWTPSQATFALHISTNKNLESVVYKDLLDRMADIHLSLESEETQGSAISGLMLVRIYFFIKTRTATEKIRSLAQYQKGIYNVR